MGLNGRIINFLGDSITFGFSLESPNEAYHQLLKNYFSLKEARNYGICGTRIARQTPIEDTGECFAIRYKSMKPADMVVVFGGTNDHSHGNAPFGSLDDRTPDTFCGALNTLFNGLCEHYDKKSIVVMTPIRKENDDIPNKVSGKSLEQYVNAIIKIAGIYGLPVLDMYHFCDINPNILEQKNTYCPDGIHPNKEGHRIIAEMLGNFLINLQD